MAEPFGIDSLSVEPQDAATRVRDNWLVVKHEVADEASKHGRDPAEIKIVGVTKYVDAAITQWLVAAGCHDLGENRPQHLWAKAAELTPVPSTQDSDTDEDQSICWHQIGHLQRNKVRRLLRSTSGSLFVHAVDNAALLQVLAEEAERQQCDVDVLIEVNISDEEAKTGLPAKKLGEFWDDSHDRITKAMHSAATGSGGVRIRGLMAMAGWGTDALAAQTQFRQLRELRDRLQSEWGLTMPELSMGMSGDFPAAIAEGATMVRIGSRLFAGLRSD
ncbi:MAG: YggS family pyridoxal phosphate-dependent enzyme [Planctomycetota bacterium]